MIEGKWKEEYSVKIFDVRVCLMIIYYFIYFISHILNRRKNNIDEGNFYTNTISIAYDIACLYGKRI